MNIDSIRGTAAKLVHDRRGAAITEYLIIVALIAVVCIMAYRKFGKAIDRKIEQQTSKVQGI
jgi:Flp pilus assembly pilin Flp